MNCGDSITRLISHFSMWGNISTVSVTQSLQEWHRRASACLSTSVRWLVLDGVSHFLLLWCIYDYMHMNTVYGLHQSLVLRCVCKHTHIFFMPLCGWKFCMTSRSWKQGTTKFCFWLFIAHQQGCYGMNGQTDWYAKVSAWILPFHSVPGDTCMCDSPSWIYRYSFLFKNWIKGSLDTKALMH